MIITKKTERSNVLDRTSYPLIIINCKGFTLIFVYFIVSVKAHSMTLN